MRETKELKHHPHGVPQVSASCLQVPASCFSNNSGRLQHGVTAKLFSLLLHPTQPLLLMGLSDIPLLRLALIQQSVVESEITKQIHSSKGQFGSIALNMGLRVGKAVRKVLAFHFGAS